MKRHEFQLIIFNPLQHTNESSSAIYPVKLSQPGVIVLPFRLKIETRSCKNQKQGLVFCNCPYALHDYLLSSAGLKIAINLMKNFPGTSSMSANEQFFLSMPRYSVYKLQNSCIKKPRWSHSASSSAHVSPALADQMAALYKKPF